MAILYGTQSDGNLIPVQADSQGRLVAELAGIDQSVQGDLMVTGDVQLSSLNGGQLAGFRNWIINGNFTINQRGGTRTPGTGVYGFDRWKGHDQGLEQVVESLPSGQYTLSWSGGGSGTFGGTTAASPITATVAAGNTSVVVPSTATLVQLEPGPVATPFEHRPSSTELSLCQRYFRAYESTTSGSGGSVMHTCVNTSGSTGTETNWQAYIGITADMRIETPTFLFGGSTTSLILRSRSGGSLVSVDSISAVRVSKGIFTIHPSAATDPDLKTQLRGNSTDGYFGLDAEL